MEKKKIDWENLGFGYMPTEKRYVANFKDGKWDDGALIEDANIVMNRTPAGVLQYAQTVFEGLKAYTTEDGHIVAFPPGSECKTTDRFCKEIGNAAISGRTVRRCRGTGSQSKRGVCTSIRFRSNIIYKAVYVWNQSGDRCKTGG